MASSGRKASGRSTAAYVYCLVERSRRPSTARVPSGLPGATSPELIEVRNKLWAVVSEVPLATFGAEGLPPRLKNINWVADIAVAHEAVVEHFAARTDAAVIPLKLFTLFSSRERAAAEFAGRWAEIRPVLARIRGCQEWGIRVARRPQPVKRTVHSTASGTAFLTAKKELRDASRVASIQAAEVAETVFDTLSRMAQASHRREPPESATTPPFVDAAFLVKTGRQPRFRAAARRLAASCRTAGAELVLTGPWPPYNFVQATAEKA